MNVHKFIIFALFFVFVSSPVSAEFLSPEFKIKVAQEFWKKLEPKDKASITNSCWNEKGYLGKNTHLCLVAMQPSLQK